ncbi:hypoxanthine phosphoribosyltransferase [Siphonobacter aquaeclarae]|uniref:Hypoxanthine phosphoribosyltransferase n=1 Tax=Siphonobacter aquaeclarae TaxID=563176 RepID=A0A1G9UJA6_9BACT|nr:hypoxanthine phosphoribosyltransferase [Siphonobacter aquaeclarae]
MAVIQVHDKFFDVFIDKETLEHRIAYLAAEINADYSDRQPLLIAVLNGSFLFVAELMKSLKIPCEITFIRVSSYQGTGTSGVVKQVLGLNEDIRDRDVIIIEDIVDTGHTMAELLGQLTARKPRSVEIATMLHKPEATRIPVNLKYVGFAIENRFVLGYGLDYDGLGRNLPCIYQLVE